VPAYLEELLTSCRAQLTTETAQRRWGRGLDYFLKRCRTIGGTARVGLARDIVDFLGESYGLARAKEGQTEQLGRTVQALEQECRRIVKEDPTPLFAWGVIRDRDPAHPTDLKSFIESARRLEPPSGATFTFNPVILVSGGLVRLDWTGLGRLYLSEDRRMASLKIAPPSDLIGAAFEAFLIRSIETGLDRTDERTIKKSLAWSSAPHRQLLAALRSN